MRTACLAILLVAPSAAPFDTRAHGTQDADVAALATKCGSEIEWINDPFEPFEGLPRQGEPADPPRVDRLALIEKAKAQAKEQKRLILCYLFRLEGRHMYRAPILDKYMNAVVWSDEEIVDLVKRRFVPLRLYCDADVGAALGVKAPDFVEPAILVLDAGGRIERKIHRIRTFNADWVRSQLAGCVPAETAEPATAVDRAIALRRARRGDEALAALKDETTGEAAAERGLILLRQGKLAEARRELAGALTSKRAAEAEYHLSLVDWLTGDEEGARNRWQKLARSHAATRWGWKAAMNLSTWKDTRPEGPVPHGFEDVFWAPEAAYDGRMERTRWSRTEKDVDDIVARAVAFLLRQQRSDGSWSDARYAYWPTPAILPNVRVAVTSLACAALLEWRSADPARVDAAIEKGEKYILDEANMARGKNEECYADAYKLLYLARSHALAKDRERRNAALKAMAQVVKSIETSMKRDGLWAHEYPNPFASAAVIGCLFEARKENAQIVPDALLRKAGEALQKQRGDDGGYTYGSGRKPSGLKDSAGRMPMCEMALAICGLTKPEAVAPALDNWWAHYDRIELVRTCDFHSDGELAGFFFFHDFFHATQAAWFLKEKLRREHLQRFLAELLKLPELDGSFIDDHELGKSYGTSMALLSLRNCLRRK